MQDKTTCGKVIVAHYFTTWFSRQTMQSMCFTLCVAWCVLHNVCCTVRAISILVHMDLFLSHWTKTGPRWTKTCPGFNQKVLNFISIISPRIQSYYLQKCCEIFFFIFKCYGTFFEGFIETNLNPGPKHVQGGPKTVQRNMTLDQNMSLWVKTCPDCLKNSPGSIPYFGGGGGG